MTSIDTPSPMTESDTIAAIATAPGTAGIAIVRMSGPDSFRIADEVYSGKQRPSDLPAYAFTHGHIRNGSDGDTPVDEVILLAYRAPQSYTCEDVVEIQCHGGSICAERILATIIGHGARPAQPGEFTKRAFLNGRLDLLQAEAVADLIAARSSRSAEAAVEQLMGSLSISINSTYDSLCALAADIEASLDFVEDELPEATEADILGRALDIAEALEAELRGWQEGHLLREGAIAVISGKPNVGKSTLMNALLGKDRAIVANSAGTTRDTLEEDLVLAGVAIRLVDTAGLRDSVCQVEREGVRRAFEAARGADLRLHVVDASVMLKENEHEIIAGFNKKTAIIVLNKCDLGQVTTTGEIPPGLPCISTSLLDGRGVQEIRDEIKNAILKVDSREPRAVISERHRALVQSALSEMNACCLLLKHGIEENSVLAAQHMRATLECLGTIVGREYSQELLDSIFSRFCIGK